MSLRRGGRDEYLEWRKACLWRRNKVDRGRRRAIREETVAEAAQDPVLPDPQASVDRICDARPRRLVWEPTVPQGGKTYEREMIGH
jgi:hypothetical protein